MLALLRSWAARAREVFQTRRLADEQDAELRFHLEMETDHNRRLGMSEADAHRAAVIAFGGRERFREETRDARGISALEHLLRDTRFALRRLRRAPGFTAGAVLTLGIGIGSAVGIGTIVYGVLLRDLPYPEPDRLVHVSFVTPGIPSTGADHPEVTYNYLSRSSRSLSALAAYWVQEGVNIGGGGTPERATVASVTPGTFAMLQTMPAIGRVFTEREMTHLGNAAVLISHALWMRRFGGDSTIIGRRIELSLNHPRVVGVMPPGFDFPRPSVDVWYAAWTEYQKPALANRGLTVVGRLAPSTDIRAAEAELNALLAGLPDRYPEISTEMLEQSGARVRLETLQASIVAPVRAQLVLLAIMVGVVLLIASTNVLNLLLLRVERAEHEIAVSRALGAGVSHVARRYVVEGLTLGALSLLIALPVTTIALATRFGFTPLEIPRLHEVAFGPETAAALLVSTAVIGGLIGVAAAWRAFARRSGERGALHGTRATPGGIWRRAQQGLVVTQVAIALALIVASALMARSFWNLRNVDIGFTAAEASSFSVSLPYGISPTYGTYTSYGDMARFHTSVMDRLAALPGVTGVAGTRHLPLTSEGAPELDMLLRAVDGPFRDGRGEPLTISVQGSMATPGYFATMHMPIREGRAFERGDLARAEPGVVLSATLARALFGDASALGRRVQYIRERGVQRRFEVVGVAGDVHSGAIEEGFTPIIYFPQMRDAEGLPPDSLPIPLKPREFTYVIRGQSLPTVATVRDIVREMDHRIPVVEMTPLTTLVDDATARTRLTLLLLGVAAAASLILGVIGVYSVLAYAAAGRTREFGVRMALGATPSRIASSVLGEGAVLTAVGIMLGVALALAASRVLRALLYEVRATSVLEYLAATLLLLLVTLAAILLPAMRAARTDPAVVLRGE